MFRLNIYKIGEHTYRVRHKPTGLFKIAKVSSTVENIQNEISYQLAMRSKELIRDLLYKKYGDYNDMWRYTEQKHMKYILKSIASAGKRMRACY